MRVLFCVIITLAAEVASEGCHFGYEGPEGVDHWGDDYGECLGKHQSPIAIDSHHVTRASLPPLEMNGFDVALPATVTNNGHTAMMTIDSDKTPTVRGGPLNGTYKFAQLHFHWGSDDNCGSEDKINDKVYPLEMHLVFYKDEYLDSNCALAHPDGLCVLGCLFEIQENDNEGYSDFVKTLGQITKVNSVGKLSNPPALFDLIPSVLSSYFTYSGSLTTPPCSEVVTWIDFYDTVKISHKQLQAFRDLTDSEGNTLVNNFRAVQPLGDRVVTFCEEEIDCSSFIQKAKRFIARLTDEFFDIFNSLSTI